MEESGWNVIPAKDAFQRREIGRAKSITDALCPPVFARTFAPLSDDSVKKEATSYIIRVADYILNCLPSVNQICACLFVCLHPSLSLSFIWNAIFFFF